DIEIVFERRIAVHLDAERLGDRAVAAAAGDQIVGGDALAPSSREVVHGRDHAVVVLLEGFEPAIEPHLHAGKAFGAGAQDRIEPELVAALRPLRADRAGRASTVAGTLDAGDFEAGERGEIEHRVRIILGRAGFAHRVGDAPAAEEFHGAGVLRIGARMRDAAVALLDQEAPDAAPAEIDGEAEPDRPAANDQHRNVRDVLACHYLFSLQ